MKFSIIIPTKGNSEELEECISHCLKLDHNNFEIIILPDKEILPDEEINIRDVKIVQTGPISPGEKRDIGMKIAKGDILAFIDDDAYPDVAWLKNAEKYLEREDVVAVGGPHVTPYSDDIYKRASGLILSSFLATGKYNFEFKDRVNSKDKCVLNVEEQPSCNLFVKRSEMLKINGHDTKYWPGEDSILCGKLRKSGKKILHASDVIVFHHRRPLFRKFWKQISNYGFHRGMFFRYGYDVPFSLTYFIPSAFILFIFVGFIIQFFSYYARLLYFLVLSIYFITVFLISLKTFRNTGSLKIALLVLSGLILVQVAYGMNFLKGLIVPKS
jgi:cellulose synthase/poly-beta-1,6-N-acetylglucosamine synthase-like glycosyltransferase